MTASDGVNGTLQNVAISVTDINEAPAFTSGASASIAENQLAAYDADATDPEGTPLTYSVQAPMPRYSTSTQQPARYVQGAPI